MPSQVEWTGAWPHTAEVLSAHGGAWCLTVRLKQGWKPFAWTVCHKTNPLAGRAGEASKLDFAILQAEAAMTELENASVPAGTARGDGAAGGLAGNV